MHRSTDVTRRLVRTIFAVALVAGMGLTSAGPAQAVNVAQSQIVNPNPANFTPDILNGQVNSIVQIGGTVYAAGQFTQVQTAGGGATFR